MSTRPGPERDTEVIRRCRERNRRLYSQAQVRNPALFVTTDSPLQCLAPFQIEQAMRRFRSLVGAEGSVITDDWQSLLDLTLTVGENEAILLDNGAKLPLEERREARATEEDVRDAEERRAAREIIQVCDAFHDAGIDGAQAMNLIVSSDTELAQNPRIDEGDIPGQAFSSLRDAWQGYTIAVNNDETERAKQFAAVINGIRAAFGQTPLSFDELDGFRGVDLNAALSKVDVDPNFYRVRLRDPNEFDTCRIPDWAENAASSVVEGAKVTTCRTPDGEWLPQSVLVPRARGRSEADAEAAAEKIQEEIEGDDRLGKHQKDEDEEEDQLYQDARVRWELCQPEHPLDVLPKDGIAIITGKRGSGKSAAAYDLAEQAHKRRGESIYVVGFPDDKRNLLPDFCESTEVTDTKRVFQHIPEGSFVVLDEAFRMFHARESQSGESVEMSKMIPLARQNKWSMVFVSQDSSYLDLNVVREADALFFKEPSELHMRFERNEIADLMQDASAAFDELGEDSMPVEYVFAMSDEYTGMLRNNLPGFWSEELSHAFAGEVLAQDHFDRVSAGGCVSP